MFNKNPQLLTSIAGMAFNNDGLSADGMSGGKSLLKGFKMAPNYYEMVH